MPHSDRLLTQAAMGPAAVAYSANCLAMYADAVAQTRCVLDVPYGSDPSQLLDVFLPDVDPDVHLPIIFFIHGGAWTNGSKEWSGFAAPSLTSLPAILVCPSYRLLPQVSFPDPVIDCIAALKWVQDHRHEWGSNIGRVVLAGHSAGAQIAALISMRPDLCEAQQIDSDLIAGCLCVGATFNRRMVNPNGAPAHVPPGDPNDFRNIQPDSPLALADKAVVPFMIVWGGAEDERVARTARLMEEKLQAAGRSVETLVVDGLDHFDMHMDFADVNSESRAALAKWMKKEILV